MKQRKIIFISITLVLISIILIAQMGNSEPDITAPDVEIVEIEKPEEIITEEPEVTLEPELLDEIELEEDEVTADFDAALVLEDQSEEVLPIAESPDQVIANEDAMDTAVLHAGVKKEDVIFTKYEIDPDKDYIEGEELYDLVFFVGDTTYIYEVHAKTGQVMSYKIEVDDIE